MPAMTRLRSKMLHELPRSSLLSEWKFFVRGLVAHYQGDAEACQANWDRLDPKRKARQIAQHLRDSAKPSDRNANANFPNLEKLAFGEPVLARLVELQRLMAEHEWTRAMQLLAGLRQSLARTDHRLAERLTRILMAPVINAVSDMGPLTAKLSLIASRAPPSRLRSTPSGVDSGPSAPIGPEPTTKSYANTGPRTPPTSRRIPRSTRPSVPLAKAMVWNAVSMSYIEEANELPDLPGMTELLARFFSEPEDSETAAILKKQAVECLERSLKLAPDHLPTYQLLIETHRQWNDQAAVELAAHRLIEKFPDDLETLTFLVNSCIDKDKLDDALSDVRRARRKSLSTSRSESTK